MILAVLRSRRTERTLWRIRLYVLANFVVPTLACTKSCNSAASVLSSSEEEQDHERRGNYDCDHHEALTHMSITDCVVFSDPVDWGQDVNKEAFKSARVHV